MKHRVLNQGNEKLHVIIFEAGEDAVEGLTRFSTNSGVTSASFTAIGAFEDATVSYFDRKKKDYLKIPVEEQVEVLSFMGDIALTKGGEPKVHIHCVLGKRDGSCVGGDLKACRVWPTLEVVLRETPAVLRRTYDEESGLALIDPDAS